MSYLTPSQLAAMGFADLGQNVLVSDKASLYNCAGIAIGNDVRIDDFCVVSAGDGGIRFGNGIHLAVHVSVIGTAEIALADFSSLSFHVAVFSSSDDFSGAAMTNPMVPREFTNVQHAAVSIGRHVIVGAGSVILPGAVLEEGVAVGALSLVAGRCAEFGIYAGVPARRVKERSRELLRVEQQLLAQRGSGK